MKVHSTPIKTTLYINKENIKLESVLNEDFSMMELEKALQSKKDSTPGNDNIPYQVYKHLPITSKQTMLKLINNIWNTSQIPAPLKHTILIPVAKPHKNSSDPSSYRPIALIPCFMKLMEAMINNRLEWYFEEKKTFSPHL